MNNLYGKLKNLGLEVPSILIPKTADDPANFIKWPVIACDQFTQDRAYWEKVKAAASDAPSTHNLIFPEVYLCDTDVSQRITGIHSAMKKYLKENIFMEAKKGFIYIERDTSFNVKRRGLIAAVDLEHYDWHPEARPLIRSTEGTVADRLPPRMDIRRGAPLELPHILLLIDDETDSLLPALGELAKSGAADAKPLYSTPLMMDCGSVTGWFLDTESGRQAEKILSVTAGKLQSLLERSLKRYIKDAKTDGDSPFLYAVGDGNHSLAAAKGIWQEYRENGGTDMLHPCRYALAEIENIYDPAIQFEPIHRLVIGLGFDEIIRVLSQLPDFSCRSIDSADGLSAAVCGGLKENTRERGPGNVFGVISEGRYALIETSAHGIATACLQPLLDSCAAGKNAVIDYIHD